MSPCNNVAVLQLTGTRSLGNRGKLVSNMRQSAHFVDSLQEEDRSADGHWLVL